MNISTIIFVPVVLFISVIIHSCYIFEFSNRLKKSFSFGRKIVGFKKNKLMKALDVKTRKESPLERKHNKRMGHFFYLFIGSCAFLGLMIHFETKGQSKAETLMEAIKENTYSAIRYQDSEQPLAYLYCGARNCAGLNVETGEINYFPQSALSYRKARKPDGANNAPKQPA